MVKKNYTSSLSSEIVERFDGSIPRDKSRSEMIQTLMEKYLSQNEEDEEIERRDWNQDGDTGYE